MCDRRRLRMVTLSDIMKPCPTGGFLMRIRLLSSLLQMQMDPSSRNSWTNNALEALTINCSHLQIESWHSRTMTMTSDAGWDQIEVLRMDTIQSYELSIYYRTYYLPEPCICNLYPCEPELFICNVFPCLPELFICKYFISMFT